jgi:hypothetical protein
LKFVVAVAAVLSLLVACGVDRGGQKVNQQSVITETVEASPETFALGTELSPSGAVAERGISDAVVRGGEVYVSVDVHGASTNQKIEVQWLDPNGEVIRSEERRVSQGAQYIPFSSGRTEDWKPGAHRAVIVIDGRRVSEKKFAVM